MNYQIIKNKEKFLSFIEYLPKLNVGEMFYGCLFARKKYDKTGVIKSDKQQLKRFTSTKDYLYTKIKQLECEIGSYTYDGKPVPEESLALYIMPNPRSLKNALKASVKDFVDLIVKEDYNKNPYKIALTNIQKSVSRKVYLDFDFDDMNYDNTKFKFINDDCLTILQTRGGFHVLVEVSKIDKQYVKTWYNAMKYLGPDVSGDCLMPVPGCRQGNFEPYFIEK